MTTADQTASPFAPFVLDIAGHVATLTITNPRRKNALSQAGWRALRPALEEVDRSAARVLVVTGAGEDFCAGADLSGEPDQRHQLSRMQEINQSCLALHRLRVPVISRVDGYAVGAGMNLALAADFVVASSRAKFAEIFVKRGLTVDFGGSWLLPRLVGLHRAKEMVLLGEMVDAATLHRMGVVREVVEPAALDAAVAALANTLAAAAPIAIAQSKRLLNDSFDSSLEVALEGEARAQTINGTTKDTPEAIAAFFAKRTPVFEGR